MKGNKKKEEKTIPIAKGRDIINPMDEEIRKLRDEGMEVPRELIKRKHEFNK